MYTKGAVPANTKVLVYNRGNQYLKASKNWLDRQELKEQILIAKPPS